MIDRKNSLPELKIKSKLCGDTQLFGAFPRGDKLTLTLSAPRAHAMISPVLTLRSDSGPAGEVCFGFAGLDGSHDLYKAELILDEIGLFWYDVACIYSGKTVSVAKDVQLSVYRDDFSTPDWIKGGVMYQIFVDRFARGGSVPVRDDAVLISDWENGEPEFPEVRGGPLKNNTFFGGTLYGVVDKLDYLVSLGVNCIYLNPVFEAYSNHKYDTGDYEKIDEMFGGREAFDLLIAESAKRGIRVILDGVFNHTGDDSKYFNKYGRYGSSGAYRDRNSPYFPWFNFKEYPSEYESWWNVDILPRVKSDEPSYREYMLGENGIVRRYISSGAGGWRLDVADELSSGFLDELRKAVKDRDAEALIIGEVWEDASNKVSYGERRRYLLGSELDSVMNYVMRNAIIEFVTGGKAEDFADRARTLYMHYPKCVSDVQMNVLGTHDTARILNVLGAQYPQDASNGELSRFRLSAKQRETALARLKTAWLICATIPGVPCIYYGDEAGMEGWGDPFCRRPYPWGREDTDLLEFYRRVCRFRRANGAYADGVFRIVRAKDGVLIFSRGEGGRKLYTAVNNGDKPFRLSRGFTDAFTGRPVAQLDPHSGTVLHK